MNRSYTSNRNVPIFQHWGWLFGWGLVLVILGALAISLSTLTTLVSVILLGALIFTSGVVIIIDSFKFWGDKWSEYSLHLIIGLFYLVVGLMLMTQPVSGSVSLTFLLGIFYIFLGACRIIYSTALRFSQWKWSLLNGIISLFLGVLIMANWPAASLFIIGLFVGIDLLFCGWTYMLIALAGRR